MRYSVQLRNSYYHNLPHNTISQKLKRGSHSTRPNIDITKSITKEETITALEN